MPFANFGWLTARRRSVPSELAVHSRRFAALGPEVKEQPVGLT